MSGFDSAFDALIANEGGYSNNRHDPGGETRWGITKRVAQVHGYTGAMWDLPLVTAKEIAKAQYWNPIKGDEFPERFAFQVFDAAYNSGVGTAIRWLQQAVGVLADGSIGPVTLTAVKAHEPDWIIARFDGLRLRYLADLKAWPNFGRGWAHRIADNLLKEAS